MRYDSGFYKPRTKAGFIQALLPKWAGTKTALREMDIKQLRAIYYNKMQTTLLQLCKKEKAQ